MGTRDAQSLCIQTKHFEDSMQSPDEYVPRALAGPQRWARHDVVCNGDIGVEVNAGVSVLVETGTQCS